MYCVGILCHHIINYIHMKMFNDTLHMFVACLGFSVVCEHLRNLVSDWKGGGGEIQGLIDRL